MSSGLAPWLCAMVCATPCSPSQSPVDTGPGLTVFTRIPAGPTSLDSALQTFVSVALAAQ